MRTERHKCGCVSEVGRERWIKLCDQHQAEFDERHKRAAQDHRNSDQQETP